MLLHHLQTRSSTLESLDLDFVLSLFSPLSPRPEPEAESTTTPDDSVDLKVKHEDVKEEVGVKEEEADAVRVSLFVFLSQASV
jgi:hypothetical protein